MFNPRNKLEISFISKLYIRLIHHESDHCTLDYCNYGLPLSGIELVAVRHKRVLNDFVTLEVSGMLKNVQITVSAEGSSDCEKPRLLLIGIVHLLQRSFNLLAAGGLPVTLSPCQK